MTDRGRIKKSKKNIFDLNLMSISELIDFFASKKISALDENKAYKRVSEETLHLLKRISYVNLAYLNPSRRIKSLSGGESSRLKLSGIL